MIFYQNELANPVHVNLEYGYYIYEFEVQNAVSCDPRLITIVSGRLNGFSRAATEIDHP